MWCQQKKKFAGGLVNYDVPDYLHIQGIYETTMYTKVHGCNSEPLLRHVGENE